jgi:hypothetical protein
MSASLIKSFLLLSLFISANSYAGDQPSDEILDQITKNTLLIVPLNLYAPDLTVEEAREIFSHKCLDKLDMTVNQKMNCEVLKTCEGDSCVSEYANQGTAFLMNNGKELHTAWHVLFSTHAAGLTFASNYLESASVEKRQKIYDNLNPMFVLLDKDLKIVYDTRVESETSYTVIGNPLSTIFSNNGRNSKGVYGYIENIPEDFVQIQLTKSLGSGFKKAERKPKENLNGPFITAGFGFDKKETVFSIEMGGQVASILELKTQMKNFMEFQLHPLSVERSEFWKMSSEDQLVLIGYSRESAQEQISKYPKETIESAIRTVVAVQGRNERDIKIERNYNVLLTTNPSLPGASGGPMLNSEGEVIGIVTNGFSFFDKESGVSSAHGSGAHLF